ncbi:hypothetical protein JCM19037_2649 [Geomicrobium sp. JCM 19037]|uniref:DUF3887 domain-containing protein n=1 Tax=Geomicrobium sp. JCM 19037 TaxID=1460634 RepID=UPI00045F2A43|nr:DUF3887 domain-containing protein [Geomicrobium sp. JCM 19037]GAK04260.1 hypothetical protein JCM19037_2649 [Geomicrobium sp. JCM 19037]
MKHWVLIGIVTSLLLTGCQEQGSVNLSEAERFIDRMQSGEFKEAAEQISVDLKAHISPELIEDAWVTANERYGNVLQYDYVNTKFEDGFETIYFHGTVTDMQRLVSVSFNEQDDVIGFHFTHEE